ncbi:hypothetical protein CLV30_11439 [Haloactinopolyspora alba]|uniref:Shikimate kinase n=2 Tax=Haloactinopolyspora alba TaxID=648780 RepID=A0A2P8DVR8_9ACTN|nr:hypothetical protein CLV30_11439 [Haloactinopolyspora alba]
MSATGKTSTIRRLAELGHHAVDLDADEWSHLVPDGSEYADPEADTPLDWRWREGEVRALLDAAPGPLFVAGTSTGQASFYPALEHVVTLMVPTDVAMSRLASRTVHEYGKGPDELRRELNLRETVGPQLSAGACLVIDTSVHSVHEVTAIVLGHAGMA